MKFLALCSFFLMSVFSFGQKEKLDLFFKKTDVFMVMNVSNGLLNYKSLASNQVALDDLVGLINEIKVKELTHRNYQKAFLINSYNLLVIKSITNNYPVQSPMQIPGFFKVNKHKVADFGTVTLNDLENKLIRKVYKDPRVHFALVCAGKSCPPIIEKAYMPETLDEQLTTQTQQSLNNPNFIQAKENKVVVSEIFKWYKSDFGKNDREVIKFINKYKTENLSEETKLDYYTYDWTLNSLNQITEANSKSNILEFTPSKLMQKGQWDVKLFNNLYTQTKSADNNQNITKGEPRQTYFTSTLEAYTGISKNARFNVGAIINLKSNSGNNTSAFDVFNFSTNHGESRAGISSVGLALKVSPFKRINNFSIQSNLFFPVFSDVSGSFYLDKRSYVWENRFYFDKSFGADKFQIFTQLDLTYNFGELSKNASLEENAGERFANNSLAFPLAVFLSYFPSQKFTVYVNAQQYQLVPTVKGGFGQEFTVAGIGAKYQATDKLNLELSSSRFLRGTSSGLGNTYNLGLRFVY